MFNKKKQPPIKSLIAEGSRIQGDIRFTDGLRIDGEVIGGIRADDERGSMLVVSETAKVTGSITADHIIINGSVKGRSMRSTCWNSSPRPALRAMSSTPRWRCTKGL